MVNTFKKLQKELQRSNSTLAAYLSELAGTALMMFNGLAWVCWILGSGSPISNWLPNPTLRLFLVGVCFGGGVAAIAYSPLGQRSGGHLNPAVTLGFWLLNKIDTPVAIVYILMQTIGAFIGTALVLLLFPDLAIGVSLGMTVLGKGVTPVVGFTLEVAITFLLMLTILVVVNSQWKRWTGMAAAIFIALIVLVEAPLTGTSMNPARSLAPAILMHFWQDQWIYLIAPLLGAAIAVFFYQQGAIGTGKSFCSKLYHPKETCHHHRCGYCHPDLVDDFKKPS